MVYLLLLILGILGLGIIMYNTTNPSFEFLKGKNGKGYITNVNRQKGLDLETLGKIKSFSIWESNQLIYCVVVCKNSEIDVSSGTPFEKEVHVEFENIRKRIINRNQYRVDKIKTTTLPRTKKVTNCP